MQSSYSMPSWKEIRKIFEDTHKWDKRWNKLLLIFLGLTVLLAIVIYSLTSNLASNSIINNVVATFPKSTNWQEPIDAKISYTDFSTANAASKLLSGTSQVGNGTVSSLIDARAENQEYLKQNGWVVDNNLTADGPTGSVWGYKKIINPNSTGTSGQTQILQLSYTNESITPVPNQPVQFTCPCNLLYKIFLSNPF